MTSWKELDIDIPTKIFVEVFTKRAAPFIPKVKMALKYILPRPMIKEKKPVRW